MIGHAWIQELESTSIGFWWASGTHISRTAFLSGQGCALRRRLLRLCRRTCRPVDPQYLPVVPLDTIYQPRYTVVEESHHSGVFNRTSRTWSHEFHKSVHVQYCQSPVLSVTYGLGFALVIVFPNSLDDFVDVRRRDFLLLLLFLLFLVSTPPVPAFWIRRYPWVFLFERA